MIPTSIPRTTRRSRTGFFSQRCTAEAAAATLCYDNKRIAATVLEASDYDVHLISAATPEIGQVVSIAYGTPDRGTEISGIIHWVKAAAGQSEFGIVLNDCLPFEYLMIADGCQRKSLRYTCRVPGSVNRVSEGFSTEHAVAVNYSRNGLCLQMDMAPPVETQICFAWQRNLSACRLQGVVRWVIGQGRDFLVGCELTRDFGYRINGVEI